MMIVHYQQNGSTTITEELDQNETERLMDTLEALHDSGEGVFTLWVEIL